MAKRIIAPRGEHVSWQLQYRKCGKPHCRTCEGKGHGPYWYAYWREKGSGKVTSVYVGKQLPQEIAQQLAGAGEEGCRQDKQALTSYALAEEPPVKLQSDLIQLRCGA